jgi:DNA polymerase I
MNTLTFDWEVTTHNKGSPFDSRNKAVCIGKKINDSPASCQFRPHLFHFDNEAFDLYIGFNLKFDLHWTRKFQQLPTKIWDCQVAEFVLSGQTTPYPSLEETAQKYQLGHKIDVVKLEYWDKGINTDAIPPDVLSTYCCQDVDLTYQVYLKQLEQFQQQPALYKLFKLMMLDLLVLEEMEWNGIKYDEELCKQKSIEIEKQIIAVKEQLQAVYKDVPINFNSPDQLSAFLYGGTIKEDIKVHEGFFKTGTKAGQPKYKKAIKEHVLPRLVEPIKKLAKENVYATDEATLRKLKGPAAKKFVGPLLELAKLDKLQSTYYAGLLTKARDAFWEEHFIHGQFNQCVAATGRLSSSKPNLQNFSGECLDLFISRY